MRLLLLAAGTMIALIVPTSPTSSDPSSCALSSSLRPVLFLRERACLLTVRRLSGGGRGGKGRGKAKRNKMNGATKDQRKRQKLQQARLRAERKRRGRLAMEALQSVTESDDEDRNERELHGAGGSSRISNVDTARLTEANRMILAKYIPELRKAYNFTFDDGEDNGKDGRENMDESDQNPISRKDVNFEIQLRDHMSAEDAKFVSEISRSKNADEAIKDGETLIRKAFGEEALADMKKRYEIFTKSLKEKKKLQKERKEKENASSRCKENKPLNLEKLTRRLHKLEQKEQRAQEQERHPEEDIQDPISMALVQSSADSKSPLTEKQRKMAKRLARLISQRKRFENKMMSFKAANDNETQDNAHADKSNSCVESEIPDAFSEHTEDKEVESQDGHDLGDIFDPDSKENPPTKEEIRRRCSRTVRDYFENTREVFGVKDSMINDILKNHDGKSMLSLLKRLDEGYVTNTYYHAIGKYLEGRDRPKQAEAEKNGKQEEPEVLLFELFLYVKNELNWFRKWVFKNYWIRKKAILHGAGR
mmetsp:Transcript_18843/g.46220  ORF Transcript_18843/g.46220 Transcript_18843/m.46220 type:complete len:536 (-) Transcript_18843:75-1682(-)